MKGQKSKYMVTVARPKDNPRSHLGTCLSINLRFQKIIINQYSLMLMINSMLFIQFHKKVSWAAPRHPTKTLMHWSTMSSTKTLGAVCFLDIGGLEWISF